MLSFTNPLVLLGGATFLLVGVPVLIHLINMMRHRRVEWAAMEFLLASQKKNRTYILLKQLLLLAMRMAAIAALIFIVARPLFKDSRFANMLGGTITHHVVVLDDSYSMSDRGSDQSAFEKAKEVVTRIAQRAADGTPQQFTLIRTSRNEPEAGFMQERLTGEFDMKLGAHLKSLQPTQLSAGPEETLGKIDEILEKNDSENRLVYIVSDFRENEWGDPIELSKKMLQLSDGGTQLILVSCADKTNENIGIVGLRPLSKSRAAGLPIPMEVSVKNFGTRVARGVNVEILEDRLKAPGLSIDQIAPGQTETRRFTVNFPVGGPHRVVAQTGADSIDADNHRHVVVDVPLEVPVLVIDGSPLERDAWLLSLVLNPGGTPGTGIKVITKNPEYLADHALEPFAVIYLVNVERLGQASVEALEKYLQQGGGVAFFVGQHTDHEAVTTAMYRDGAGFFPAPLGPSTELLVQSLDKTADLKVTNHPVLNIFAGERNTFLNDVRIVRYFSVPKNWNPPEKSGVDVVGRLRNNAPLIIEKKFGTGKTPGRVMAFLTTAGPLWNNWAMNPSFVVLTHELQAYLAGTDADTRAVGAPIELLLDPAIYSSDVQLFRPGQRSEIPLRNIAQTVKEGLSAQFGSNDLAASGVYELQLQRLDKSAESRFYAYNVAPEEGNLKVTTAEQLTGRLAGVNFVYQKAGDFEGISANKTGGNLHEWILYALIVLLVLEQMLAYAMGYHPPQKKAAPAAGGVARA